MYHGPRCDGEGQEGAGLAMLESMRVAAIRRHRRPFTPTTSPTGSGKLGLELTLHQAGGLQGRRDDRAG